MKEIQRDVLAPSFHLRGKRVGNELERTPFSRNRSQMPPFSPPLPLPESMPRTCSRVTKVLRLLLVPLVSSTRCDIHAPSRVCFHPLRNAAFRIRSFFQRILSLFLSLFFLNLIIASDSFRVWRESPPCFAPPPHLSLKSSSSSSLHA